MKIPVVYFNLNPEASAIDYWDMAMIKDMLSGKMWQPALGYEFEYLESYDLLPLPQYNNGAVVVIPARQNHGFETEVNKFINLLDWCVILLCGDEAREFDTSKLTHPNKKVWLMQPTPLDQADYYMGSGYTPHLKQTPTEYKGTAEKAYLNKELDWYFAGQNNHIRRSLAANVLRKMLNRDDIKGNLLETDGFTHGVAREIYSLNVFAAKAIPSPSGIESPDSFRVYEALEAGAVPIADDISKQWPEPGYWAKAFNDEPLPFKVLTDYENLEGYICDIVRDYPRMQNTTFAWWQNYKRKMVYKLQEHVNEISGLPYIQDTVSSKITILVMTSPIKSHPDTKIIDQCIADMRTVLPDCEILIGIDGVRPEQEHYRERYEQYKERLLWKCNNVWSNVNPVVFEEHMHQAAMTRELLRMVKTETILFVEHDTPLCPDFYYEWDDLVKCIESGEAYTIRFLHEADVLAVHKHLMIGEPEMVGSQKLWRTSQWSNRPHLSSTAFYRSMIGTYFNDESRTFIEDKVHGYPDEAYRTEGMQGWYQWRIWIYYPSYGNDKNIKRSYNLDGRGDDPKYEVRF